MDRYWVGGTGTWDATTTTNWSATSGGAGGASAPTSVDNVIFNSASNATLYTVTVGTNAVCADFTAAGPLVGNVTFSLGATARIDCYGSMTLPATGLTWTSVLNALVTFRATTTGKTVTTNGVSLGNTNIAFDGVGGGWTLGSAFSSGSIFSVLAGTLDSANFNITCGIFRSQSSANRTLTLGSSTFTTTNASSGGWDNINSGSTFTLNAGTSQIISNGGFIWLEFSDFSGKTFYNVRFTRTSGMTVGNANTYNEIDFSAPAPAANFAITGSNTIANLKIATLSALGVTAFLFSADQTVTGTFTVQTGNTDLTKRILLRSNTPGTQRTLTAAAISFGSGLDFQGIVAAGAASPFDVSALAGGNGLNNSNITFPAAKDVYWNLVAGGNWSATGWALSSGGAVNASNFPLAQDRVIIENTGLNTSATITINAGFLVGELDLSTRSNAMTLASGAQVPRFYKNVTLSSVVTMTGTGAWFFVGQGTAQILDVNTVTFVPPITIDSGTGTLQLAENATCSATVTLTSGTLNLNNFNLTCNIFLFAGSLTRAIAFGAGVINVTGTTGIILNCNNGAGFSYTGTPRFNLTGGGAGTRTIGLIQSGFTEANSVDVYVTSGSGIINHTGTGLTYRTLDFTGFSGTFTRPTGTTQFGNLTLGSGMTITATTSTLSFNATSGTQLITTNGVVLDFPVSQVGVGGTVQLQDNLTMGSTRTFTLTNGSLDLDDNTLTTGLFNSNAVNIRSIAFGTGGINVTGNAATVWNMGTATNFTFTGTPTVNLSYSGSTGTRGISFTTGATATNALNFNVTDGTDIVTMPFVSRNFNFTGFAGTLSLGASGSLLIYGNYTLSSGMTITGGGVALTFSATSGTQQITTAGRTLNTPLTFNGIGGTFAFQDALTQGSTRAFTITNGTVQLKDGATSTVGVFATSGTNQKFLQSTLAGTQATLSQASGTVNASYLTIQDINATGGATWNSLTTNNNVDGGNNDGWDFGIVPITFAELNGFKLRSFTQPRRF